ncbi:HAMP domain-containing sensor histidine kinase [Rhizosphaericola mali]|uniref:histidine kinase n=1 Tax=Rhizosphaericola mali TaxID=2545455 RepID=A0A5P2FXU9_9BACT|nr:ATP-binding protein [Rhizosphaericola mali]QES88364.1 HAMP domain-containing protein [Rhizosphaericola mali]
MKIKVKLTVWVGLLFAMIVALSVLSTIYINRLKDDTGNILVSNYNSLEYSRNMLDALDKIHKDSSLGTKQFIHFINLQRKNITEKGENYYSDNISQFTPDIVKNEWQIRKDIYAIMNVNMKAITRKSELAQHTANEATTIIIFTGTLCFVIAFTLLFNLPSNIANPIKELTTSIQQIAAHNYEERVHFEQHNEFGILAKSFNAMAMKLEEYSNSSVSKLLIEKKRIETLINKMQDPVIGMDQDYKILFANEKALQVTGLHRENLIGANVQNIAMTNDLLRTLVKDLFQEKEKIAKIEPIKIFFEGKESYFEKETISIDILPTGEKEIKKAGYFVLLRNITPFKELDLAKTNFIANVSHELKTPIASIKMGTDLLLSEPNQTENEQSLIKGINEDADRLLKITGELLNLTQAESGNIQIRKSNYALDEILEYALDTVRVAAKQRNITLINNTVPHQSVSADKDKTIWVITNLLTNAIRYSPENSEIKLNTSNDNDKLKIEISDEGQGIESKYQQRIFERYFKIPGNTNSGTGLGLSICKEFMEAQGGSIEVRNNESGIGSTFELVFPKMY